MIGLTPDELNLCQSLDTDLVFIFALLDGEMEPEEGEFFLASPAVKNYHINWNLFLLGSQIPLEKVEGGGRSGFWWSPGSSERKSSVCAMTFRLKDRFCWYGMLRDAKNYVSSWGPCSRNKPPQRHAQVPCRGSYGEGTPRFSGTLALYSTGQSVRHGEGRPVHQVSGMHPLALPDS